MADTKKIITEVDALVKTAERLAQDAAHAQPPLGPERIQELSSIAVRGGQLIQKLYSPGSQYEQSWTQQPFFLEPSWRTRFEKSPRRPEWQRLLRTASR